MILALFAAVAFIAALALAFAIWAASAVLSEQRRRRAEPNTPGAPADVARMDAQLSKLLNLVDNTFGRVDRAMRKTFGARKNIWEAEFRVPDEDSPLDIFDLLRRDTPTIKCVKCGARNRIPKGVAGARCGGCHEQLSHAVN